MPDDITGAYEPAEPAAGAPEPAAAAISAAPAQLALAMDALRRLALNEPLTGLLAEQGGSESLPDLLAAEIDARIAHAAGAIEAIARLGEVAVAPELPPLPTGTYTSDERIAPQALVDALDFPGAFCSLCGSVHSADLGQVIGICLDGEACRRRSSALRRVAGERDELRREAAALERNWRADRDKLVALRTWAVSALPGPSWARALAIFDRDFTPQRQPGSQPAVPEGKPCGCDEYTVCDECAGAELPF